MPEPSQSSSPPPYIDHGGVPATHIGTLNVDSEGGSSGPVNPQVSSTSHEIAGDRAPVTQPVDKQNLTTPPSVSCPDTSGSTGNNPGKSISKLEQAIQYLESSREHRLFTRLEAIVSRQSEVDAHLSNVKRDTRKPIKLKDAVGRRFSFPYHRCETWAGIGQLIKAAFIHVEIIGPHVNEGHYDIMNPAGEIILPQLWEEHVQPGWEISMSMWPIPCPKPRLPPAPLNAPVHVIVDRLPGPPPQPAPCFHPLFPPRYHSDDDSVVSKRKGICGIWHKVKGMSTKKRTNHDSNSSRSLADN